MAAGTAAKGIGATVSLKAAVATGAAVVATASVGAVAVLHRPARERAAAPPRPAVVRHPSNPAPRRGSLTAVSSQPAAVPAHRSVHRRSAEGAELHRARHRDAPVARPSVVREKLKPATAVAPPAGRSRAAPAPRSHVHQGAPHAVRAMHSPAAARKHTPRTATPAARIGKPKHVSRGRAAPKPHPAGGAGVRGKSSPSAHSPAAPAPAAPTRSTVAASATSTGNAATGPTGGQPAGASAGHSANKSASTS